MIEINGEALTLSDIESIRSRYRLLGKDNGIINFADATINASEFNFKCKNITIDCNKILINDKDKNGNIVYKTSEGRMSRRISKLGVHNADCEIRSDMNEFGFTDCKNIKVCSNSFDATLYIGDKSDDNKLEIINSDGYGLYTITVYGAPSSCVNVVVKVQSSRTVKEFKISAISKLRAWDYTISVIQGYVFFAEASSVLKIGEENIKRLAFSDVRIVNSDKMLSGFGSSRKPSNKQMTVMQFIDKAREKYKMPRGYKFSYKFTTLDTNKKNNKGLSLGLAVLMRE